MPLIKDPWRKADGAPRVLFGVAGNSGSPRLAEMAGLAGFDAVWIDIEHGSVGAADIEKMCLAVERGGATTIVRVPDGGRRHILWALEAGAHIVVVPMVNDAATAQEIVQHGKFAPLGRRGYNTLSRGMGYGLGGVRASLEKANSSTHLIAQIETKEAVANVAEICAVEGLAGILVGPGDLSVGYGCTGDNSDPHLIEAAVHCISHARSAGKHAGIVVGPGPLLDAARRAGADLMIVGSDVADLAVAWQQLIGELGVTRSG